MLDQFFVVGSKKLLDHLISGRSITLPGVKFEEGYTSRIVAELDGVPVNIIDLPHLKVNKRAAGLLKDLADWRICRNPREEPRRPAGPEACSLIRL
jgi:hypothetical protein